MALFDGDDDAERTTMQVAFSALKAIGHRGCVAHRRRVARVRSAAISRVPLGVRGLGGRAVRGGRAASCASCRACSRGCRCTVVVGAWTLAIRPWGGTIVRPIVEGLGKLTRRG